jgi:4-hydroxybenzoyl-CoA thioesterase
MSIRHEVEIGFGDADPAGIAYYPRILDLCHRAFEALFADAAGAPYATTFLREGIGFPTVALQAEFRAPMRFGERVCVEARVAEVTARSVAFEYRFVRVGDGTICATARNVAVAVNRQTFAPVPIPEPLAAALRRHVGP